MLLVQFLSFLSYCEKILGIIGLQCGALPNDGLNLNAEDS